MMSGKSWSKTLLLLLLLLVLSLLAWHWLSLVPVSSSQGENESNIQCQDIWEAWNLIEGFDYVWGGDSKEDGGFDCSGAIYKVSKLIGEPVPRTTSKKYYLSTKGPDMHWGEADCGYVIWWTLDPSRPYGHLGMHYEQPTVWHSGSSTGPTRERMWKSGYWDEYFESSRKFYK